MSTSSQLMAGKRGLVMGVANDRSIAWGIASALAAHGAELAFTYQGDALAKRVKPLAESPAPADAPPAGKAAKPDDRATKWKDNLARDPWVDESLNIMSDMTTK